MPTQADTIIQRFWDTMELQEAGIEMMYLQLQRKNPSATPEEVEALLCEWLMTPKSPYGDNVRVVEWPRK